MSEPILSIKDSINEILEEEMLKNSGLLIVGEDLYDAERKDVQDSLKKKYPDRFLPLPILEDMAGSIGLGMVLGGLKPVIGLSYGTFLTLALSDIYMLGNWRYRTAEKTDPGIIIRISYGGEKRGSEFSTSLLSTAFHIPNIWIAAPSSPYFAKELLRCSLKLSRPVLFFEHKNLYSFKDEKRHGGISFPASFLFSAGKDLTIISWSYMTKVVREVVAELQKENFSIEHLSLETLYPFDKKAVMNSAQKTGKVMIVEEDPLRGGLGAEIGLEILEKFPHCRIKRVAAADFPLPVAQWEKYSIPGKVRIIREIRSFIKVEGNFFLRFLGK